MNEIRGRVGLAALVGFVILATQGVAGTIVTVGTSQSTNWAGYNQGLLEKPGALGTLGFQSVSGDWIVPTATQHMPGQAEHSAAWVGIGGGLVTPALPVSDVTLIQAGTNQEVDAAGNATYSTWWEIIPLPQIPANVPVKAGDQIHVDIHQTLPEVWVISIDNRSNGVGADFTTTVPYASDFSTAEWILETLTVISADETGVASLPNLGTVRFLNASVNGDPANLLSSEAMQLIDSKGNVIATPSAPTGGTAFNVCTYSAGC